MLDLLIKGGSIADGTGAEPFTGDIGIRGGRIVEVGAVTAAAKRTLDADGLLVTPGFVDIHTHFDGQATWDPMLSPSFENGVTTAVLGNCGVGFAPVRRGDEEWLIEIMEGVEEIPGSALAAGLRWNWESFPDYLAALDEIPRTLDIGALVPHGALRSYVMGRRVHDDQATDADVAAMRGLLDEALRHGALGLSSSRTRVHKTGRKEMTPDFFAEERELIELLHAVARHDAIYQVALRGVSGESQIDLEQEMAMLGHIAELTRAHVHFTMMQTEGAPEYWREQVRQAELAAQRGVRLRPHYAARGISVLMGFFNTNPYMFRPTYERVIKEAGADRLRVLAQESVRRQILAEGQNDSKWVRGVLQNWPRIYQLGRGTDYEPDESTTVAAIARARGVAPDEAAYDLMLENGDQGFLWSPFLNYAHSHLDHVAELLEHPLCVWSASDAGAHVGTICDGAVPTFMLTHWARDRARGRRVSVAQAVHAMTQHTAESFGIFDRGVIAPGYKADINLIDFDRLAVEPPRIAHDLPAGAARLLQGARGYVATVVSGVVTRERDEDTGARPGRLLRRGARA